jgi:arylsulfatase A-like enzyme
MMLSSIFMGVMATMSSCADTAQENADTVSALSPNILLVVADDVGWTDLGSFGSEIGTNGGRKVDAFAYVWDVMPTILEFAGIAHPEAYQGRQVERMRGRSLKDVLTGSSEAVYGADDLVGGEMQNGKWIRRGDLKAVSVAPPYGSGDWHLYNVVDDPGETRNLANDQPEKLKELQEAWERYAKDVGQGCRRGFV